MILETAKRAAAQLKTCGCLTLAVISMIVSMTELAYASEEPKIIHVYTHGDTRFARFDENKQVSGKVADLTKCVAEVIPLEFEFHFAPLSRATSLLDSQDHMMWFPSGPREEGDEERRRMMGPLGTVDILWYQLKSSEFDVNTPNFLQEAKVSAYKGSIFEERLRREGYNYVQGSADHNRIMYTLISGEVDAVLAVDFRFKLSDETQHMIANRLKTTLENQVPVYLTLSRHMADEHPDLTNILMNQLSACNTGTHAR